MNDNKNKTQTEDNGQVERMLGRLVAINKKTGVERKVKIINIDQKRVYLNGDRWGIWHNYSKRGDWVLLSA